MGKHLIPVLLVTMCVVATPGRARAADSSAVSGSLPTIFTNDVGIFFRDAGLFFTGPLRFSEREWLCTAGAVAGTALVMTTDMEIKQRVERSAGSTGKNDFWRFPKGYGTVEFAGPFAVLTYGTGLLLGNDDIRVTGRLLVESLLLSGTPELVLKYIFGRSRPYGNNSQWDFTWFRTNDTFESFPSGHTVVAFSVSTVLAERIDNLWARIGFYGAASLTAFERMYDNQHWASDVLVGAGLGLLGGFFVVGKEREREHPSSESTGRLQIEPTINGIRIVYLLQ